MATTENKKKPAAAASANEGKAQPTTQAAPAADSRNALQKRKSMVGTVVSNKMQKTIVVKVDRRVRHSMYKKYLVKSVRYKAHDEKNEAKVGDRVELVESRPLSRDKRWVLQSIVRRAGQVLEANV